MNYLRFLWILFTLSQLLASISCLSVNISYSFFLPKKLGVATTEQANCCPFGKLPRNETHGMAVPTVFGLGTQKGGTTTLYAYFNRNPLVYGTSKELHYLDSNNKNVEHDLMKYLLRWPYNKRFVGSQIEKSKHPPNLDGPLFEISPSYLLIPFSACRAKHISPNGKFIVFLREPVDRAVSGFHYSSSVVSRKHPATKPSWIYGGFLPSIAKGLSELKSKPECDFHTGKGVYSYNDCFGCALRDVSVQKRCQYRPFVTITDKFNNFKCTSVGQEVILRGLYGAQLAWWFTLFPPSSFKIYNSFDFFKDPKKIMTDVIDFLGVRQDFTEHMMAKEKRANKGHYKHIDRDQVERAKKVLQKYYRRPNLELYRLMEETGHSEFTPFEPALRTMSAINCAATGDNHTINCWDSKQTSDSKYDVHVVLSDWLYRGTNVDKDQDSKPSKTTVSAPKKKESNEVEKPVMETETQEQLVKAESSIPTKTIDKSSGSGMNKSTVVTSDAPHMDVKKNKTANNSLEVSSSPTKAADSSTPYSIENVGISTSFELNPNITTVAYDELSGSDTNQNLQIEELLNSEANESTQSAEHDESNKVMQPGDNQYKTDNELATEPDNTDTEVQGDQSSTSSESSDVSSEPQNPFVEPDQEAPASEDVNENRAFQQHLIQSSFSMEDTQEIVPLKETVALEDQEIQIAKSFPDKESTAGEETNTGDLDTAKKLPDVYSELEHKKGAEMLVHKVWYRSQSTEMHHGYNPLGVAVDYYLHWFFASVLLLLLIYGFFLRRGPRRAHQS